jgi:predicted nucleotidyltransferase
MHQMPTDRPGLTLGELRSQREAILRAAAGRGARVVRVFGWVARGEAGADSDVDFLVEFEPGRTLVDLSGLELDLSKLLEQAVHVLQIPRSSALTPSEEEVAKRISQQAVPL